MSIVIHGMDMPTDKPIALIINPDGQVSEVGNFDQTWEAAPAPSCDRWISDRPPLQDEANGYVLAVVDGECGNAKFYGALVLAEYDPPCGEWFVDAYPDGIFKVKAWRPLPEPPKEET